MPIPRQPFEADREGPLRGVRVLDFSRLVAGNMLSLQLADFGAEVVKVESPGRRDTTLALSPSRRRADSWPSPRSPGRATASPP